MPKPDNQPGKWRLLAFLVMLLAGGALSTSVALAAFPAKNSQQGMSSQSAAPNNPQAPQAILYDQYDSANESVFSYCASGTCSNTRHSQAADDFVVPGGQSWTITEVDIGGNLISGPNEPTSFNVFFYNNTGTAPNGLPSTVVISHTNLATFVGAQPAYTITIPSTVLPAGTYWVSVQAVGTSSWQWTSRSVQSGSGAAWRGTVVGTCPNWGRKSGTCFTGGTYSGSPDQFFRLQGTAVVSQTATPTRTNTPTVTPTATHVAQPQLYCQITNAVDAIRSSTNFGAQTADDFIVPAGLSWSISQIDVNGSLSGGVTEPPSFNVFFYNDNGTLPGTVVISHTAITQWTKDVSTSIYTINIPATNLAPGSYWVSVQAVGGSNWFWSGRDPQTNDGAAHRGSGGCADWTDRNTCVPPYTSQDQAFCVRGGTLVPTNTPTRTSTATATSTATVTRTPTRTATNTPIGGVPTSTACPVQFNDVPSGSTFYSFVRCLACRGIVSGYACGAPTEPCPGTYYRPGVNVTRGQISKMVAIAAELSDPAGTRKFEDVPEGSTFYLWIQQLANTGAIAGYPCGGTNPATGAAEPCVGPGNLAYFRPNSNTTRGQLTKIVSQAAGFDEDPGAQQFTDVPPAGTFFVWVQRLFNRGVVSGYPCGGTNPDTGAPEPCDAESRKYFRVNNNVTRGQTAKIVAETFFPSCVTPARE
ncbi:MAG: S-layer homology domain-containing protein [Chloroflexota bacterium]|nr:S-layer homology domain-containing protein [Chloroflexota bacterium]